MYSLGLFCSGRNRLLTLIQDQ